MGVPWKIGPNCDSGQKWTRLVVWSGTILLLGAQGLSRFSTCLIRLSPFLSLKLSLGLGFGSTRPYLTAPLTITDFIRSYIDAFKYGSYPHAGAGIGMERVVM